MDINNQRFTFPRLHVRAATVQPCLWCRSVLSLYGQSFLTIFNADLQYCFYLEPVLMQFAADEAGWEQGGSLGPLARPGPPASGAQRCQTGGSCWIDHAEPLERHILGVNLPFIWILAGCEEEDGAIRAVHGCVSAVCVEGVLVKAVLSRQSMSVYSCWEYMIPPLISSLGNMDLGQEEHHQCSCLYHPFVEPTNSPDFLLSQPCFCLPSSPSGRDYHTSC